MTSTLVMNHDTTKCASLFPRGWRGRDFSPKRGKYCIPNRQFLVGCLLQMHSNPIKPMSDEDVLTSEKIYKNNLLEPKLVCSVPR